MLPWLENLVPTLFVVLHIYENKTTFFPFFKLMHHKKLTLLIVLYRDTGFVALVVLGGVIKKHLIKNSITLSLPPSIRK